MKLGFFSAILPDLDLEKVVRFAAAERFACVELACWPKMKADRRYAGITHLEAAGFTRSDAARIRDLFAAAKVEISGLGYYPNPLTPARPEARASLQHLKRVIRAASLLEVNLVNTFVGRDWTRSVDENWPRFCKVWKPLVQFAADRGVRIAIENCPMLFTRDEWPGGKNLAHTPEIWRRMFEEIPAKNFGLNFDPSHFVWQQLDIARALREFGSRLFHVHAKDARLDRDALARVGILAHPLQFHTPKLPGMGDVNWGALVAVLNDVGYRGPVCIEVEDRAYEGSLANRKRALVQSRRFLEPYVV